MILIEILEHFFRMYCSKNYDSENVQNILDFVPSINNFTFPRAKEFVDFILIKFPFVSLTLNIIDVFSINGEKRILATKNLKDENMKDFWLAKNQKGEWIYNAMLNLQKTKINTLSYSLIDEYLDNSKTDVVYKEEFDIYKNLAKPVQIDIGNLSNFVKVIENKQIDISIRIAALEQIIEIIPLKNHKNNANNEIMISIINFTVKELHGFDSKIKKNIQLENETQESKSQIIYLSRLLNIINIFISHCNYCEELKLNIISNLKNPKNPFLKILIEGVNIFNKEAKFQVLKTFYLIFFNCGNVAKYLNLTTLKTYSSYEVNSY